MAKKIEVEMAAIGAEATAADIRKVEKAQEDLQDSGDKVSKQGERQAVQQGNHARTLEQLGKGFETVGNVARQAADQFRDASPEFASTADSIADGMDRMSGAATMAAQGFAAGGPLGGAIGGMVGVMLPEMRSALNDIVEGLENEARAAAEGEEIHKRLNDMLAMGQGAYKEAVEAAANYKQATDDLNESLDAQATALERRNKVLDAKASADSAERDAADAAEIRGGAAPEDVKANRASWDAEQARQKVMRDLDAKEQQESAAGKKLDQAQKNLEVYQNNPQLQDTPESQQEIERLKNDIETMERAFAKAKNDYETARDIAPEKIRQIDTKEGATVAAQQAAKYERTKREQDAQTAKEDAERQRKQDQEDRERSRQEPIDQKTAAQYGREAVDLVPSSAPAGVREAIQKISERLQNGDQGGELQELIGMLTTIANAIPGIKASESQAMRELRNKVAVLEGQMKNPRNRQ